MGDVSIDVIIKNFKLLNNGETITKEISCECEYPCHTNLCPKELHSENYLDSICHANLCEVIEEYSKLTYNKNFCSKCGRKL